MMNRIAALTVLCGFLSLSTTHYSASELTQSIKTQDGFTIYLPEDWVQIPRQVLDEYSRTILRAAPGLPKQEYDYGFQKTTIENWLTLPYILIKIERVGRVPEKELMKNYKVFRKGMEKAAKQFESSASFISKVAVGKPVYEPESHILWTNMTVEGQGAGPVEMLGASRLTQAGSISIFGYAQASNFGQYGPLYEQIARNVQLDEHLKYRPRDLIGSFTIMGAIRAMLIGGLVGVALPFIWAIVRRKKRGKKRQLIKNNRCTKAGKEVLILSYL